MENRTEREKGNGMVALGCLFVPDSTLAPYSASTGAVSVSTGAESASTGAESVSTGAESAGIGAESASTGAESASTGAESAGTGAESASTGAESREEREERLWREEMEAAGLSGEQEENLAAENDGDSITVTMLPKSNAPTEPAPGMDALTRLWGMTTELWYDYKRGKRIWGKLRTTDYTDKWNVGSRPVMHFAEMLLRAYPPTIEDARKMAELLALHRRTLPSRADRQNAITDINELRSMNAGWACSPGRPPKERKEWDEASAIRYLKGRGYMVLKNVKAAVRF